MELELCGPEETKPFLGSSEDSGPLGYRTGVDMKAVGWPTRVKPEIESLAHMSSVKDFMILY